MSTDERPASVYEQIMADPEARHAFLHTTQGILYGDPEDEEVKRILVVLDTARVAYLFASDLHLPRPQFRTKNKVAVGEDEIALVLEELSVETQTAVAGDHAHSGASVHDQGIGHSVAPPSTVGRLHDPGVTL